MALAHDRHFCILFGPVTEIESDVESPSRSVVLIDKLLQQPCLPLWPQQKQW